MTDEAKKKKVVNIKRTAAEKEMLARNQKLIERYPKNKGIVPYGSDKHLSMIERAYKTAYGMDFELAELLIAEGPSVATQARYAIAKGMIKQRDSVPTVEGL